MSFLFCNSVRDHPSRKYPRSNPNKQLPHKNKATGCQQKRGRHFQLHTEQFSPAKTRASVRSHIFNGCSGTKRQVAKGKATKADWSTQGSSFQENGPAPSPLTKKTFMGKRFQGHTPTPWLYPYRQNPQDTSTRADTFSISTLGLRTVRGLQDSLSKYVFHTSSDRELSQAGLGSVRSTSYGKNLRVQNASPTGPGSNTTPLWQQRITHMAGI